MVLSVTRRFGRTAQVALFAMAVFTFAPGCASGPEETRNARVQNQRLDKMEKAREELAKSDGSSTARSQSPIVPPPDKAPIEDPTVTPVTNISVSDKPPVPTLQGE